MIPSPHDLPRPWYTRRGRVVRRKAGGQLWKGRAACDVPLVTRISDRGWWRSATLLQQRCTTNWDHYGADTDSSKRFCEENEARRYRERRDVYEARVAFRERYAVCPPSVPPLSGCRDHEDCCASRCRGIECAYERTLNCA